MEEKVWKSSLNEDSDDDNVYLQNASDDEQDFHFSPTSFHNLQFRNIKSKGRWNEEMGMAEVYEKNGKMWVTTGIVRNGKIYTSIEETLHFKSLGYIIARHDVAWSLKSIKSSLIFSDLEGTEERKELVDMVSIDKLFGDLKINDLNPDFDVYLPNNRFRKSSPGDPHFLLHLSRGHPPSRAEIEATEKQYGGIPLKICLVTEGRVSFFSSDKVELPVLS